MCLIWGRSTPFLSPALLFPFRGLPKSVAPAASGAAALSCTEPFGLGRPGFDRWRMVVLSCDGMKYLWPVLSNILFIGILLLIFANIYDPDLQKVIAAMVIVYLALITQANALARQIGQQSYALITVMVTLHKRAHPSTADDEVRSAEEGLKTLQETLATSEIKLLIHAAFSVCVGIGMVLLLLD